MYNVLKQFIEVKYYESEEVVKDILNVFLVTGELTPAQYAELALLAKNIYNPYIPPVVEEPTEPEIEEDPVTV